MSYVYSDGGGFIAEEEVWESGERFNIVEMINWEMISRGTNDGNDSCVMVMFSVVVVMVSTAIKKKKKTSVVGRVVLLMVVVVVIALVTVLVAMVEIDDGIVPGGERNRE